MLRHVLLVSAWLVISATPTHSQAIDSTHLAVNSPEELTERVDRFTFYTGCAPLWYIVDVQDEAADQLDISAERLELMLRSRLRAGRIFNDSGDLTAEDLMLASLYRFGLRPDVRLPPGLLLGVHVVGSAYNIEIEIQKSLFDPESQQWLWAGLGTQSITGIHGGDASHVLEGISELIDRFLDNYLRVNAEACNSKR